MKPNVRRYKTRRRRGQNDAVFTSVIRVFENLIEPGCTIVSKKQFKGEKQK